MNCRLQATFSLGMLFGDISLLTNSRRTATVLCKSDCVLLTLGKHIYDQIMGETGKQ